MLWFLRPHCNFPFEIIKFTLHYLTLPRKVCHTDDVPTLGKVSHRDHITWKRCHSIWWVCHRDAQAPGSTCHRASTWQTMPQRHPDTWQRMSWNTPIPGKGCHETSKNLAKDASETSQHLARYVAETPKHLEAHVTEPALGKICPRDTSAPGKGCYETPEHLEKDVMTHQSTWQSMPQRHPNTWQRMSWDIPTPGKRCHDTYQHLVKYASETPEHLAKVVMTHTST